MTPFKRPNIGCKQWIQSAVNDSIGIEPTHRVGDWVLEGQTRLHPSAPTFLLHALSTFVSVDEKSPSHERRNAATLRELQAPDSSRAGNTGVIHPLKGKKEAQAQGRSKSRTRDQLEEEVALSEVNEFVASLDENAYTGASRRTTQYCSVALSPTRPPLEPTAKEPFLQTPQSWQLLWNSCQVALCQLGKALIKLEC